MRVKAVVVNTGRGNLQDINLYLSPTAEVTFLGKVIIHVKGKNGWMPVVFWETMGSLAVIGRK